MSNSNQNIQSMESYSGDNTEIDIKEITQEEVQHIVCEKSPYVCGDQIDKGFENNENSTTIDIQRPQSEQTTRSVHKSMSAESNRVDKNKRPGIPVLKKNKLKQDNQDISSPPETPHHRTPRYHGLNNPNEGKSETPRTSTTIADYKTESDISYNGSDVTDLSQQEGSKLILSAWEPPKPLSVPKKKFERKFKSAIPTKGIDMKKTEIRKTEKPIKTVEVQKRNIETQFNIKKKKLANLKKELEEKQKPLIDLYKSLIELKKKSEQEGMVLMLDEIKIVTYQPFDGNKINEEDPNKLNIDPKKVTELTVQVQNIPIRCIDICNILAKRRVTILDNVFNDRGEWSQDQVVKKVNMCKENIKKCEIQIQKRLKEEERNIQNLVTEWQNLMMTAGVDDSCIRDELAQKLEETEHKLKQTVDALQFEKSKKLKDIEKMKDTERELSIVKGRVEELSRNLKEEKNTSKSHQERYLSLDQKFKTAKNKIREIDAAKHDFENKIEQLKTNQKKNEAEWKSKEVFYENRHKELLKSLKNAEQTIVNLEKERHSVNCRADELEENWKGCDEKYNTIINNKDTEIEQLKQELEQIKLTNEQLESKNKNLKVQLIEKEGYDKSVVEILHTKHEMRGELELNTELERDLWRELSVARNQLEKANEKLESYALEKARFIETMRRNKGEGEPLKQLMEKENEISTLKIQNKQLQNATESNLLVIDELKAKLKVYERQCEELSATTTISEEKDNNELLMIYQDKLKLALQEYENCESAVLDLKHRLHTVETGLKEHQKMVLERDALLGKAQEKKNCLALENENLKNYVKHLRFQLAELNEEHSMKLAELQGTYCLLEEKTHYVTKLESTLQDIEQKQGMSKLKSSSRQTLIQQRSDILTNSDISPLNMSVERRNRFLQNFNYEKHISSATNQKSCIINSKKTNFSLDTKQDKLKNCNHEYITDLIMNTLFYKESPQEFIKHAKNLASYESTNSISHSKKNSFLSSTVHGSTSMCCIESEIFKDFHDPRRNDKVLKNIHVDLNLKLHGARATVIISRLLLQKQIFHVLK